MTTMKESTQLVIGLYGISGAGKSYLLRQLQLVHPEWRCVEGSAIIEQILQSKKLNWNDFKELDETTKTMIRELAIQKIQNWTGITIVAGHCSFPIVVRDGSLVAFNDVFTNGDSNTYDAIYYLHVVPEIVSQQRDQDRYSNTRDRPNYSTDQLQAWIEHEVEFLREKCELHKIRFNLVENVHDLERRILLDMVTPLVSKAKVQSECALRQAVQCLPSSNVYLLIDGDHTLTPNDSGREFFRVAKEEGLPVGDDPLKQIFQRYPKCTFQAFWEVALLYAKEFPSVAYEELAMRVGSQFIKLFPKWLEFLSHLPSNTHCAVVSCSVREVWHAALNQHQLLSLSNNMMSIIAGNHADLHPYLVDDHAKKIVGQVASRLYRNIVW